jgi:hypothetical protein
MGLNFLPSDSKEAIYSKYKAHLQYIRIGSMLLMILQLLYHLFISDDSFFSTQGADIILALLFEILAVLTYSVTELGKLTCLFFVTSWTFITTSGIMLIIFLPNFGIFDLLGYFPWLVLSWTTC